MIVVDTDVVVTAWNRRSEDLWGLRAEETVGQYHLDIGLAVEQIKPLVHTALADQDVAPLQLDAVNRRGRTIAIRVACTPLHSTAGREPDGAIVLVDEQTAPA